MLCEKSSFSGEARQLSVFICHSSAAAYFCWLRCVRATESQRMCRGTLDRQRRASFCLYVLFKLEEKTSQTGCQKKSSGVSFRTQFYFVCRFTKFSIHIYKSHYFKLVLKSSSNICQCIFIKTHNLMIQGRLSLPYEALWFFNLAITFLIIFWVLLCIEVKIERCSP